MKRPLRKKITNKPQRCLLVTTGDVDGIGVEIAAKALKKISLRRLGCHVCVFLSPSALNYFKKHGPRAHYLASNLSDVRSQIETAPLPQPKIFIILSSAPPVDWVVESAKICLRYSRRFALVTGPLSKPLIRDSGYSAIGHTEILKNISGKKKLFMGFLGKHFNVVLATGHLPLHKVPAALTAGLIADAVAAASVLRNMTEKKHLPIAVLGLNPHAGDDTLIGNFEERLLAPLLKKLTKRRNALVGPLVPDAAFSPDNQNRFSVFLAMYHDQGLLPFKLAHGQNSGAHVTIGLPFVRTSVDHGTAKNIFGQGVANPNSMMDALLWAKRLIGAKT